MENEYWGQQRPGMGQVTCAWAIVLALAILFGIAELVWPHQPAVFALRSAAMVQSDDAAETDDKDRLASEDREPTSQRRRTFSGRPKDLFLSRVDE